MKTLASILHKRDGLHFPVRGHNGYGGEQDGSRVLFAGFQTSSRKRAESIMVPDSAEIHYSRYSSAGWTGAVGVWSDRVTEEDINASSLEFT